MKDKQYVWVLQRQEPYECYSPRGIFASYSGALAFLRQEYGTANVRRIKPGVVDVNNQFYWYTIRRTRVRD